MKPITKIFDIIRNNGGYITTKDLEKNIINRYYISRLHKEGKIVRVSRGYYLLKNGFVDNFYVVLSKCKKAFFFYYDILTVGVYL